jgi:hypothetical protein
MATKLRFFIYFFPFIVTGCASMRYSEQLQTLKEIGKSQKEIQRYIDEQEVFFYKLRDVVKNNQLQPGIPKRDFINTYGEPIISREVSNNPPIKEVLLYRHPTHYFSSDRIYLYFDESDKLVYWEYKPSQ